MSEQDKDKIVDLEQKRIDKEELTKRVKKLQELGVKPETLKQMELNEFEKSEHVITQLSNNYELFLTNMNKVFGDEWSFEEVFVYTVDMLLDELKNTVEAKENYEPEDKELFNMFDKIYDGFVQKLLSMYAGDFEAMKEEENQNERGD